MCQLDEPELSDDLALLSHTNAQMQEKISNLKNESNNWTSNSGR